MNRQYTLYGDGIHDDYPAIQEMLDAGLCEVELPAPQVRYMISATLVIPSFCRLKLPRFAEIRLMDGANCPMLANRMVESPANRLPKDSSKDALLFFDYVNKYSTEPGDTIHDFEIVGGIWNFNNMNQLPNPLQSGDWGPNGSFKGCGMMLFNVKNFRMADMTLKDPTNFAVQIDMASYFTFENITFDFNTGNPYSVNMDGIHLNGNCHYGVIRNLKGACYDDLIALNAHEGSCGDITNMEIDGIFAENCHSAVRLLTVLSDVRNIRISNVYGTYYQYCIGFTKAYAGESTGCFDRVVLDNICASKAKRLPIQEMHLWDKSRHFPLILMSPQTHVKQLVIRDMHRREFNNPIGTIVLEEGAVADDIVLENVTVENFTDAHCPLLENNGSIGKLMLIHTAENAVEGEGVIGETKII